MSDFVRPHRQQPTRLPCPWDSPGKNTGVGCHFLLQCMKVKSEKGKSLSRVRLLATPWTAAYQAPPSLGIPGKSTGVGCHCLLCQGYLSLTISHCVPAHPIVSHLHVFGANPSAWNSPPLYKSLFHSTSIKVKSCSFSKAQF